jgi:hypothetical protein
MESRKRLSITDLVIKFSPKYSPTFLLTLSKIVVENGYSVTRELSCSDEPPNGFLDMFWLLRPLYLKLL